MFKEVLEVRYTNEEQDTLLVLFNDDDNNTQEMYIEVDGADHKVLMDMGITNEAIAEQTAEWKRTSLSNIVNVAKLAASDIYNKEIAKHKAEIEKLKLKALQAKAYQKTAEDAALDAKQKVLVIKAEVQRSTDQIKKQSLTSHALDQKIQNESMDKIRAINKYVAENLGNEKLEVAVANMKRAIQTLNDNEEAIAIAGNGKKYKTLLGALKATI